MTEHQYSTSRIPVLGGDLLVGTWEPASGTADHTVVLIHGITGHHLCWPVVVASMPNVRFIAPDLRGRGRSNSLGAPFGMAQHADDVARVIEELIDDTPVTVIGHSMGGFVAAVLADRHPHLVRNVGFIDGGIPFPLPPEFSSLSTREIADKVLGPAAERLSLEFESRDAYLNVFKQHPAFVGEWSPVIEDYLDYDLTGEAPHLKAATSAEAMLADSEDQFGPGPLVEALSRWSTPGEVLRAPRGLLNGPGVYPEGFLEQTVEKLPGLEFHEVDDVNHYTIVFGATGASEIAKSITRLLSA